MRQAYAIQHAAIREYLTQRCYCSKWEYSTSELCPTLRRRRSQKSPHIDRFGREITWPQFYHSCTSTTASSAPSFRTQMGDAEARRKFPRSSRDLLPHGCCGDLISRSVSERRRLWRKSRSRPGRGLTPDRDFFGTSGRGSCSAPDESVVNRHVYLLNQCVLNLVQFLAFR